MLHKTLLVCLFAVFGLQVVQAQGETPVECGMIIEDEFTEDFQPRNYSILMSAGDSITVSGSPLGDTLNFTVGVYAPNDALVAVSEGGAYALPSDAPIARSGVLSARGGYRITAHNSSITIGNGRPCASSCNKGGIGFYTLFIGCTLRDGTVIEPGDTMPAGGGSGSSDVSNSVSAQAFSGVGFPGLVPVDFANAVKLPLIPATPMAGAITPTGGEILGFQIDASAGDVLDLSLKRLSGNLNLGLVVLSSSNEVVSYGGLITGDSLSTRLTLPSAGQYTIGVFRVDLLPPADPQATAFQVTGTLNP